MQLPSILAPSILTYLYQGPDIRSLDESSYKISRTVLVDSPTKISHYTLGTTRVGTDFCGLGSELYYESDCEVHGQGNAE